MKPTDYNDYADKWIALNTEVRMMHNHSLQSNWEKAGECADVCASLCGELKTIYDGYTKK